MTDLRGSPRSGRAERKHGGKCSKPQAKLRSEVIRLTTQTNPSDATHWSCRSMAYAAGTTHSFVHRVWWSNGMKPHLVRSFKVSTDPRYEEKLTDVVELYLNAPDNAVGCSFDEKSWVQALDRTQPSLPLKKGRRGTLTHDYMCSGTTSLFVALDVASNEVIGETYKRHRHQEVLKFLRQVEKTVRKDQRIHIILNNYSTHKHTRVMNWIERQKRLFLHFTPTSAPWLNLVRTVLQHADPKQIGRGVFYSVEDLETCLKDYIKTYNHDPRLLVWTKSAGKILDKVERARQALAVASAQSPL